jgi:hypothetical protein
MFKAGMNSHEDIKLQPQAEETLHRSDRDMDFMKK